jgi:hypothetical protein
VLENFKISCNLSIEFDDLNLSCIRHIDSWQLKGQKIL